MNMMARFTMDTCIDEQYKLYRHVLINVYILIDIDFINDDVSHKLSSLSYFIFHLLFIKGVDIKKFS